MVLRRYVYLFALALTASACGGGGGGGGGAATITGTVVAAPVAGASVTAKDTSGNTVAGPVTAGSDGSYSLDIPSSSLSSDLVIESTGGTYTDEATGTTGVSAGTVSAYVTGGTLTSGSSVHVTPSTSIVRNLVANGMTASAAASAFESAFGWTCDTSVEPTDATGPATGATEAQKLAGLREASFSQLTSDLGLDPSKQFELVEALTNDLTDGTLDGVNASGPVSTVSGDAIPVDIQCQHSCSMVNFHSGSRNQTGLGSDAIGTLPFAKVALTDTYKIQYVPGSMSAAQGKTTFTLSVTNRTTDAAVSGLSVMLMPMMYMASHSHSTPVDSVTDNGDGTYTCIVYYMMASTMNGMSMGYWKLKATVGGEVAYFFPPVMMAMSGTARATLKNSSDMIAGMTGTAETRSYYLFKNTLSGMTGSHSFSLFLSTKESMMSFPTVYSGKSLSNESGTAWTASTVTLQASTDGSTWTTMTEDGSGHFSVTGLTGLTNGTEGSIYVKLSINGTDYSTDGATASGTNAYATFTVTPSSMSM